MHDAATSEQSGTPTVVLVGTDFVTIANAKLRDMGYPGLPFAIVPSPITTTDDARRKAETVLPEVVALLVASGKER